MHHDIEYAVHTLLTLHSCASHGSVSLALMLKQCRMQHAMQNCLKTVMRSQQCKPDSQLARILTSLTNMQTPCKCRSSYLQLCCHVANVFDGCEDM